MLSVGKHVVDIAPTKNGSFEFRLKLRIENPAALWEAAAQILSGTDNPETEIIGLIGPAEDPSIEDCLMALALPRQLPGCTMLNVLLAPDSVSGV